MKLSQKIKPALVLSGGGIKAAAFHIGVCLALQEKGFRFAGGSKSRVGSEFQDDHLTFKHYVGSSAGAVMAAFLASGLSVQDLIDAFTRGAGLGLSPMRRHKGRRHSQIKPIGYTDIFKLNLKASSPSQLLQSWFNKKPMVSGGLEVLLKTGFKVNGLFTTENLERYLRTHVLTHNEFHELGVDLRVIGTQLNHSRKVVFGNYAENSKTATVKYINYAHISQAVAASAALPPFFAPYPIQNQQGQPIYYFDGEIRDTLSTHVAADDGADLVIASYSIQPYHFTREMGSLHEYGIPIIFNQALYQVVQQKITKHIEHQREVKQLINTVDGYLKQINMEPEHREKLLDILITKTHHRPNTEFIYIHPSPQDYEMFFADHFSLSPKIMARIVRTGFKSAMNTLRHYNI